MRRKNEYSLGEAIDAFLESNGIREKSLVQRVISDWERIMGKAVADNTERVWFQNGTFYVKAGNPAWRHELLMSKSRIREILNQELGAELVKEVRVL